MLTEITSFECHVTIEPVFDEKFDEFEKICSRYGFKPANLLMQKSRKTTPIRSDKDTFATGHGNDYESLFCRMTGLTGELKEAGFAVWRNKIEGILFDERTTPLVKTIKAAS